MLAGFPDSLLKLKGLTSLAVSSQGGQLGGQDVLSSTFKQPRWLRQIGGPFMQARCVPACRAERHRPLPSAMQV